jgi:hypothetical protein
VLGVSPVVEQLDLSSGSFRTASQFGQTQSHIFTVAVKSNVKFANNILLYYL